MTSANIVPAVNAAAARWFEALAAPGEPAVFAPVGVWPLLALIASGAAGPARGELEAAIGLPASEAAGAGRDLVAGLRSIPGVAAALGLWTAQEVILRDGWVRELPEGTSQPLPRDGAEARRRLDDWAARVSNGLIPAMPIRLDEDTLLVLASGVTIETAWLHPFQDRTTTPAAGPWAGREIQTVTRTTAQLDDAAVIESSAGPLTRLRVAGDNGIDVHLLLGDPAATPAAILATGIEALNPANVLPQTCADALPVGASGPGLTVGTTRSLRDQPQLHVEVPGFDLASSHDLLAHAAEFGLATATDTSRGHFPGIAAEPPLAVSSARQDAVATFSAKGFRAAAVTAFGAVRGASAPVGPWYETTRVEVRFDRPFGYLAIRRDSGLVLAGGWVAAPTPTS